MRLNLKKTISRVARLSRAYALGYGHLTLGGADLEEVRSLCILEVTCYSKWTFVTHLRDVASKTVSSLGVVCRAGNLFDCPRSVKKCFNAYVLFNLGVLCPRVDVVFGVLFEFTR